MPLVKLNLLKGRSTEEKDSIAASIQTALVSTLEVPEADRYQRQTERGSSPRPFHVPIQLNHASFGSASGGGGIRTHE
jgi:hypothetical protein